MSTDTVPIEISIFMIPRGHIRDVTVAVPREQLTNEAIEHYHQLKEAGLRLTVEALRTGQVSICIEHPDYGDYSIRLVDGMNRLKNEQSTIELLEEFDLDNYKSWLSNF